MFPSVLKIKIAIKYFHMDFGGEFESVHSLCFLKIGFENLHYNFFMDI